MGDCPSAGFSLFPVVSARGSSESFSSFPSPFQSRPAWPRSHSSWWVSRGNAPFPYLAPWSPVGAHSLACFVWSPPGWTADSPLVGFVRERLTAGVHGTSCSLCSLGRESWTSWVTWFSGSRYSCAVSPRSLLLAVRSTVLVTEVARFLYCRSLVFGLFPFSFARLGSEHPAYSFARRSCSPSVPSAVDFFGFLRLVRPNLGPCPLPLLTVVAPLPWCLGHSLQHRQPSPLPLPLRVGRGWAAKVRRRFQRPLVASATPVVFARVPGWSPLTGFCLCCGWGLPFCAFGR